MHTTRKQVFIDNSWSMIAKSGLILEHAMDERNTSTTGTGVTTHRLGFAKLIRKTVTIDVISKV